MIVFLLFRNHTDCSPEEFKGSHMVLQMDLLDSEERHSDRCVEVLQHYGRVRAYYGYCASGSSNVALQLRFQLLPVGKMLMP